MSIKSNILNYLKEGKTLTALEALRLFGTMNLRNRISELRATGKYNIQDRTIHNKENGKHYSEYWLSDEPVKTEHEEMISESNLHTEEKINRQAFEKNGQMAFIG
jgi:hypothetical protein